MGSRQQARVKHEMRTREGGEERRVENSGRLVASHQQTAGRRFSFSPKQFLKCALARSMFTPTNQTVFFCAQTEFRSLVEGTSPRETNEKQGATFFVRGPRIQSGMKNRIRTRTRSHVSAAQVSPLLPTIARKLHAINFILRRKPLLALMLFSSVTMYRGVP